MEEMGIEEKVIRGREFIHKHGQPELTMYSDCLHLYSQSGFFWMKNHRRYVRRVGYAPEWTDLLLTYADGQVCCEEWAGKTLSAKTVKNLIWLRFSVPPDFEFQLGRTNAVPGRIHRMLKLGHLNIDDDAKGLGDDEAKELERWAPGRRRVNSMQASKCLILTQF